MTCRRVSVQLRPRSRRGRPRLAPAAAVAAVLAVSTVAPAAGIAVATPGSRSAGPEHPGSTVHASPTVMPAATGSVVQRMLGVSALSPTSAWAVGETGISIHTIAAHWDGSSWTRAATPAVPRPSMLGSVVAISPTEVWAVGSTGAAKNGKALIEHLDGDAFVQVSGATLPHSSSLAAVSGTSATNIWAVGTSASQPLIEHWDGSSWSVSTAGSTGCTGRSALTGVVAVSATEAWAVGTCRYTSDAHHLESSVIETWDGSSWTGSTYAPFNTLDTISADGPNDVWVTGADHDETSALVHWDGSAWSTVALPVVWSPTALDAVTPDDVWAAGTLGGTSPAVEHWNGTKWRSVALPKLPIGGLTVAGGGTAATGIWMTGTTGHHSFALSDPADSLTGWRVVAMPNPLGPLFGAIFGQSVNSADDRWVIGQDDRTGQPLLEHWNGSAWQRLPAPVAKGRDVTIQLSSVLPFSTDDVWLFGIRKTYVQTATLLAYHWNGSSWKRENPPSPGTTLDYRLPVVSALGTDDIWITANNAYPYDGTVDHWDGSSWSIVDSLDEGEFTGIDEVSPTNVWVVGTTGSAPLASEWNGSTWVDRSAGLSAAGLSLAGVSVAPDGTVMGLSGFLGGEVQWNGSTWQLMAQGNEPDDVFGQQISAASATDAWETGEDGATLICRHWNGIQWSTIGCLTGGATYGTIVDESPTQAWVAGYAGTQTATRLTVGEWNGASWTIQRLK